MDESPDPSDLLAVIDIGSSTVKAAAYDLSGPPILIHEPNPVPTRLGRGLGPGANLAPEARSATLDAIRSFHSELGRIGARIGAVFGTEAMRIASDTGEFLGEIHDIVGDGIDVRVIPAATEARFGYLSSRATLALPAGPILTVDPGGSSNDFSYGAGERNERFVSLPFGTNRLMEIAPPERDNGRVSADEERALRQELDAWYTELSTGISDVEPPLELIAMSGAVVALGAVKQGCRESERRARALAAHGTTITIDDCVQLAERFGAMTASERMAAEPCLTPARAHVFVHGALVYERLMTMLGLERARINGFGMKLGALLDGR